MTTCLINYLGCVLMSCKKDSDPSVKMNLTEQLEQSSKGSSTSTTLSSLSVVYYWFLKDGFIVQKLLKANG